MQTLLTIAHLAFERNYQFLFENINYDLCAGEVLQVKGKNGAGKSTLLRILAGFIEPSGGKILWQQQSIIGSRDFYLQQIQYLGHHNGIKRHLTVFENLLMICALSNKNFSTKYLMQILEQLGLSQLSELYAIQLSAGQLRRLALTRLLLNPVPLWILDEPTTALDTTSQQVVMKILNEHLTAGGMAVIATHQNLQFPQVQTLYLGEQQGD